MNGTDAVYVLGDNDSELPIGTILTLKCKNGYTASRNEINIQEIVCRHIGGTKGTFVPLDGSPILKCSKGRFAEF